MSYLKVDLPQELLTRQEEEELFAWIEAGIYAGELLRRGSSHHPRAELAAVHEAGLQAVQRVWVCNLRLAAKVAQEAGRRYLLAADDLFQEACLAILDAIMRFDSARGHKFSTLAHTYVKRRVAECAQSRAGAVEGLGNRSRRLARIRETFAAEARESMPSFRQVAHAAGMSVETAARATLTLVGLDEAMPHHTSQEGHFESVETHGTDFLDLLGSDGRLLRLRFGIGTKPHTRAEVAAILNVSISTVSRFERKALTRARSVLEDDLCRLPNLAG